jgi:hypothetical protein
MRSLRWFHPFTVSLLAIAGLLFQPAPAQAWDPNARFCFRDVINTPDTYLQPPNIDGTVNGDNGWTSSWRYVFNNGTIPDVIVQGIKDSNFVYLSFEVNHDTSESADDAIVIAIDPTGAPADRRLLLIFPFGSSPTGTEVLPNYYQGYPWSMGTLPPAQTEAAKNPTPLVNGWLVELKLPRAEFGIPANGNFGLYFNVLPVSGDLVPDHPWPPSTPTMIDLLNTPDVNTWGQGTVAAVTCNGVYINPSDIRTDNTPPNQINLNTPNTFRATVHNTTIDGSGAYVAANDIRATFKIANFGLPSQWQPVPATAPATNPTATTNINANSTADLTTNWTLTAAEQATYNTRRHQCILVELESTAPAPEATVFSNKSAWTNMDFGTSSNFTFEPQIDPRGWKLAAPAQPHRLELFVTSQSDKLNREDVRKWLQTEDSSTRAAAVTAVQAPLQTAISWSNLKQLSYFPAPHDDNFRRFAELVNSSNPNVEVSQLTYLVHGCLRSGKFLKIHANNYELCERVSSYGSIVRHAAVSKPELKLEPTWKATIAPRETVVGAKIPKIVTVVGGPVLRSMEAPAEQQHLLEIPADTPVVLTNTIVVTDATAEETGGEAGGGFNWFRVILGIIVLLLIAGVLWRLKKRPTS